MRVLFVRHGETSWNLEGRYQGRADVALCETGHESARSIGRRMRGEKIALLLSSPLRRAESTAAEISKALGGIPAALDLRLTEIDFGAWQGLTQQEIKMRWPEELRSWKRRPEEFRFPGGESLREVHERIDEFLRHPPWSYYSGSGDVIVVSHAGPIRLAGLIADRRQLREFREQSVRPGEIQEFEWCAAFGLHRVSGRDTAKESS